MQHEDGLWHSLKEQMPHLKQTTHPCQTLTGVESAAESLQAGFCHVRLQKYCKRQRKDSRLMQRKRQLSKLQIQD